MTRIATITLLITMTLSMRADALTIAEFAAICDSSPGSCEDIPMVQAYIGGALDLVAMVHEETAYLSTPIYCREPREFFDVADIVRFFEAHRDEEPQRNAMLLLVRYLEERGSCER